MSVEIHNSLNTLYIPVPQGDREIDMKSIKDIILERRASPPSGDLSHDSVPLRQYFKMQGAYINSNFSVFARNWIGSATGIAQLKSDLTEIARQMDVVWLWDFIHYFSLPDSGVIRLSLYRPSKISSSRTVRWDFDDQVNFTFSKSVSTGRWSVDTPTSWNAYKAKVAELTAAPVDHTMTRISTIMDNTGSNVRFVLAGYLSGNNKDFRTYLYIYERNESAGTGDAAMSWSSLCAAVASPSLQGTLNFENDRIRLRRTGFDISMLYEQKQYSFDFFRASGGQRVITSPKEADQPVYGVELELSTDYSVRQLIEAVPDTLWVCAKQDSSITGSKSHRNEMVTLPMSFKAHKMLWAKWFSALDMRKFDTSRDTNNGMHIHVSRESFDNQRHQRDFTWFFTTPMMKAFMIEFSERGTLNDYCRMPNINPNTTKKVVARRDALSYVAGLRGVINTGTSKPTIEVRLFKGIVNFASVLKNLELVDAAFHFTQGGISYQSNPLSGFLKWLENQPKNRYEALKDYIFKVMDVEEHLNQSFAVEVAHGLSSPLQVKEKMTKLGIVFTHPSAMRVLNEMFRTTVFVWDYKKKAMSIQEDTVPRVSDAKFKELGNTYLRRYTRAS